MAPKDVNETTLYCKLDDGQMRLLKEIEKKPESFTVTDVRERLANCYFRSRKPVTVIFNNPATVTFWKDGTKTVVKCHDGDEYSPIIGLAMCICKKYFGNTGYFNEVFKEFVEGY